MNNGEISVTQALNQVQSWLNAGEFEKVIQGCQEILMLEPGNQRALALMKQAQERRNESEENTEAPKAPTEDPLANLEVEERTEEAPKPKPAPMPEPKARPSQDHLGGPIEKRKLFLALTVPAALVVLIGGAIIWVLANKKRSEQIETAANTEEVVEEQIQEEPEEDLSHLAENEERVTVLTNLGKIIEDFKDEEERFPRVSELEDLIEDSRFFDELPADPRQGEQDRSKEDFGYVYAYYDEFYVISALFEDSRGKGYPWSRGASPKHFPDFRDWDEKHVFLIGEE